MNHLTEELSIDMLAKQFFMSKYYLMHAFKDETGYTIGHATGNILYWNAVNNAKIYQVYRLENGSWVLLKNTGSLGYKDETAPVGVKCYYKIVARNGNASSNIATTSSASCTRAAS